MKAPPSDDRASHFLKHYQDNEGRKKTIFQWAGYFLVADACLFIGLLLCIFI
jgi:hypothetical protein